MEDFEAFKSSVLKKLDELIDNSFLAQKQWLTEEEVCKEFSITRQTLWKFKKDPLNPLPFSKFNDNQKQIYYNRHILNKRLIDNLQGLTPREIKKWEPIILDAAK